MPFMSMLLLLSTAASVAYMARKKGKNPYFWFLLGCLFGIIPLIVLICLKTKQISTPPPSTPPLPTPLSDKVLYWYYIGPDKKQWGPSSLMALLISEREGAIAPDTYVWNEEFTEWKKWKEVRCHYVVESETHPKK